MEIELLEIRDFLAQSTPFRLLAPNLLDALPKSMTIRYLRRGMKFPPPEIQCAIAIVRSGALELWDSDGNLSEKLAEGGVFTDLCPNSYNTATRYGEVAEDTLVYLLPCEKFAELCRQSAELDRYCRHSAPERLKHAIRNLREISAMTVEVRELLKRKPVTVTAETTIQEAVRLMTECNVSSLMVMEGEQLTGVMTDSDLRRRCLATGLSIQAPVREIMSGVLETVPLNALLSTAMMTMTRLHIRHLPVLDGQKPVGMLTISDLIRYQSTNSAFLAIDIRKAATLEELIDSSVKLPALQVQLANADVSATHIGQVVSCITDSLTQRLLELAEQRFGPPPVPYAWVTGGSQARREQTIASDQDNALIISDAVRPEDETYFTELSDFVCDGLDACGFAYCPGGTMARNPAWRQSLSEWQRYFRNWIEQPSPKTLMLATIFFDLRLVYGDVTLFDNLQQDMLERSKRNGVFIAHLVRNALTRRPPLGFFRDFTLIHDGKHDDTLDLKHYGSVPITDIARIHALSAGLPQVNTSERLHAAAQCGALNREMEENLHDAMELISSLRIRHQTRQINAGQIPDNYLLPASLSELERNHLRDAFKIIRTMQNAMESSHPLGRMVL